MHVSMSQLHRLQALLGWAAGAWLRIKLKRNLSFNLFLDSKADGGGREFQLVVRHLIPGDQLTPELVELFEVFSDVCICADQSNYVPEANWLLQGKLRCEAVDMFWGQD